MARLKATNNKKFEITGTIPLVEPVVEPEALVITDDDLKKFIINTCPVTEQEFRGKYTDPADYSRDFNSLLYKIKNFLSAGSFGSCCGVGERSLDYIDGFINTNFSSYTIGRLLYYIFNQAWNNSTTNATILALTPVIGKYIPNYSLNAAYIFTYASHQSVNKYEYLYTLGANVMDVGVNPKYPKNSNHNIKIMIIDIKNTINNFIKRNREQLVADYMKAR